MLGPDLNLRRGLPSQRVPNLWSKIANARRMAASFSVVIDAQISTSQVTNADP